MQSEIKRLIDLSECMHLSKTDRDAIKWALEQLGESAEGEQQQGNTIVYPDEFNWIWTHYPKREGTQGDKRKSLGCCNQRIKEGETWKTLAEKMQKYGKYCITKNMIGTPYVMQVQKFFGTGDHMNADWEIVPPVEPEQKSAFTKMIERANSGELYSKSFLFTKNGKTWNCAADFYSGKPPIEEQQ